MQEQIADFKNHRVEIETTQRKPAPLPSKPVSTIGGLKVNGREQSRSRSSTPLPGQREKSEIPQSDIQKKPSSSNLAVDSGLGKKRPRPAHDSADGAGRIDDEEEEWWERWRKRMRVLDGSGVKRTKKPTGGSRKKRLRNGHASARLDSVPAGIKVEVSEVDIKRSLTKKDDPDEYQQELLFVDEDEEPDAGVNEDLRILIKVCNNQLIVLNTDICHVA